jgi:hypothetical protein
MDNRIDGVINIDTTGKSIEEQTPEERREGFRRFFSFMDGEAMTRLRLDLADRLLEAKDNLIVDLRGRLGIPRQDRTREEFERIAQGIRKLDKKYFILNEAKPNEDNYLEYLKNECKVFGNGGGKISPRKLRTVKRLMREGIL